MNIKFHGCGNFSNGFCFAAKWFYFRQLNTKMSQNVINYFLIKNRVLIVIYSLLLNLHPLNGFLLRQKKRKYLMDSNTQWHVKKSTEINYFMATVIFEHFYWVLFFFFNFLKRDHFPSRLLDVFSRDRKLMMNERIKHWIKRADNEMPFLLFA